MKTKIDNNQKQWQVWTAVENERRKQKSIKELYDQGYSAFKGADYIYAAEQFHAASELARQQSNKEEQCKNLAWEADCFLMALQYKKALSVMLLAEEIGALDSVHRFYNLVHLLETSKSLSLPFAELKKLMEKLEPYKTVQEIGGSKSMVLYWEAKLLGDQGDNHTALLRMQEAMACQQAGSPRYIDGTYYRELINYYRLTGRLSEARQTLVRWKEAANGDFADEKVNQILADGQLSYSEGNLDAAWDAFQCAYAEERYIGLAGKRINTLIWLIETGAQTGRFFEVRPYLRALFAFRHSESGFTRFSCCYYFFEYYYLLLRTIQRFRLECQDNTTAYPCDLIAARNRAERWLDRAESYGNELDSLQNVNWRKNKIKKMRTAIKSLMETK